MGTIFISHVAEDGPIALHLALGLERRDYSTWCYELDSIPGLSHMDQTLQAIEECQIFILIISKTCIQSHEVTTELTRAQDLGKKVIPLLSAISHDELSAKRPEWMQRLGTVTCAPIPGDPASLVPRLEKAFSVFKINPTPVDEISKAERIANFGKLLSEKGQPHVAVASQSQPENKTLLNKLQNKKVSKVEHSYADGARHVDELTAVLEDVLRVEGLDTQTVPHDTDVVIQARKVPDNQLIKVLKTGLGLELAVTVHLRSLGSDLQVTIAPSKWADKATGAAIALVFFWPAAITTGWGMVAVQQVIDRLDGRVQNFFAKRAGR
ncbi:MAG: toll/interleukin-1 receptor domain-containing protein [bacterium]|nr:toll/interleukin-1 receptor domain-containing protein [bacterium]